MDQLEKLQEKLLEFKGEGKFSRMGRAFATDENKYFYDAGTGKIFGVKDVVYTMLRKLIETDSVYELKEIDYTMEEINIGASEILTAIEQQNILQQPDKLNMVGTHIDSLDLDLKYGRKQITLEMTEICNMRCKYCLYHDGNGGYREFGKKTMTFDIAKRAVDELMNNSGDDEVYVTFYGGEPLVCFDVVKQVIEYCNAEYSHKKIVYAMTTNGTLITKEIAEFLAEAKCIMTVSLDGPKEMHDKYRVFADGKGSYEPTINGLKMLVDAYSGNVGNYIGLSMVVPEYTPEDLNRIQSFLNELEWLPKDISYNVAYVSKQNTPMEYLGVDSDKEKELMEITRNCENFFDPIGEWGIQGLIEKYESMDDIPTIARMSISKDFQQVHSRRISDTPIQQHGFNGCCVPGARRLYVTAEGKYLVCEKMGASPFIGDVFNGVDIDKVKDIYINKFKEEAEKYCKDCWSVNMCGKCYIECYDENGVNFDYRHASCQSHRVATERVLEAYMKIYEKNPKIMEIFDEEKYI